MRFPSNFPIQLSIPSISLLKLCQCHTHDAPTPPSPSTHTSISFPLLGSTAHTKFVSISIKKKSSILKKVSCVFEKVLTVMFHKNLSQFQVKRDFSYEKNVLEHWRMREVETLFMAEALGTAGQFFLL